MNAKMLVQSLRDSKAQIMFAFLFAGHAMDNEEIQTWTGLKRQTIDAHLKGLEGMGLLAHQTAAHGRQVWLPSSEVLPIFQMSQKWTSDPLIVDVAISKGELPSITTTITNIGQMSTKRTSEELAALKVALNEYKIIGKRREQLIACEWVDADYVRAHCKAAEGEQWDSPVGMAIYRMLEQVPPPAVRGNGKNKYVEGQYVDYIEH
jgi:hypothetical protein